MAYRKSGESRERILEAAGRLFAERGYYEVGMGDIAEAAGMGRASVYYHFKDKERIARALFDSIFARIYEAAEGAAAASGDLFLHTLVIYILLFRDIALNKATKAVYYDLVHYADYDAANIERLKSTLFRDMKRLAAEYGARLSDKRVIASIMASDALAKALFKGMMNGVLDFSLEEATDYFCRRILLSDIPVPEAEYRRKLREAFRLCEGIVIA
jgi:AcrR family transcriptional regulator